MTDKATEFNVLTGELTSRDLTLEEIKTRKEKTKFLENAQIQRDLEIAKKETIKKSLSERLGLSLDEVALLFK